MKTRLLASFFLILLGAASCDDDVSTGDPCGDGIVDIGEECDGENIEEQSCFTLGYHGGTLSCTSTCTLDITSCVQAGYCGDGAVQEGEQCDGSALNGQTCTGLGHAGGTLACHDDCSFDTTGCAGNENCTNGIDDDEDGLVDCNDPDCADSAPLASNQNGICEGALKVCDTTTGVWEEPDYTSFTGYEAVESFCDGLDNNCDGTADEGVTTPFYYDGDGDGHGTDQDIVLACSAPENYVALGDDCAPYDGNHWYDCETCSDLDQDGYGDGCDLGPDCDDSVATGASCHDSCTDFYPDSDNDGYGDEGSAPDLFCIQPTGYAPNNTDCYPGVETINPGALEICDDIDNNCDGITDSGPCQPHASCKDNNRTIAAYCGCDTGYGALVTDPVTCYAGATPGPGDLAITEIMIEPLHATPQANGQYFEVYNTTDSTLILTEVGFTVDNGSTDATAVIPVPTVLEPHGYYVVGTSADSSVNGGYTAHLAFPGMPALVRSQGTIRVQRFSGGVPVTELDSVTWSASFNHVMGAALTLSPSALDASPEVLNDAAAHWCHAKQTALTGGDLGTPGAPNDPCLVDRCQLMTASTTSFIRDTSDPVTALVYEPGLTPAAGAANFLSTEVGWGPRGTAPDGEWIWASSTYTTDVGDEDEYSGILTPSLGGVYDYAFRTTLDGGLSWLLCDTTGTDGFGPDEYTPADNGVYDMQYFPEWAIMGANSSYQTSGKAIVVDAGGNSYVTGEFRGGITLGSTYIDGNSGSYNAVIAKLDIDGNVLWAKSIPGSWSSGTGIALDPSGFLFVTGYFSGAATFDATTFESPGVSAFVLKMDTDGNDVWATQALSENGNITPTGIALDSSGNPYITGYFNSDAHFGSTLLNATAYSDDVFIARLDASGSFLWAVFGGGNQVDRAQGITVDAEGNAYITGSYTQNATFGGTGLSANNDSVFFAKVDPDGSFVWALSASNGSSAHAKGTAITLDRAGNVLVTGNFVSNISFGSFYVNDSTYNTFIVRVSPAGAFLQVVEGGGAGYETPYGIAVDNEDNVYITGQFRDTTIYGTALTTAGADDIFVAKMDPSGAFVRALRAGSDSYASLTDSGMGIAVDDWQVIYVTGYFSGTADFGPNTLTTTGPNNLFVATFNP